MKLSEDQSVGVIIGLAILAILIISSLIGYYISTAFGIGAGLMGVLLVIVPALLFYREISKPDTKRQSNREVKE